MVDAYGSGPYGAIHGGSSPLSDTQREGLNTIKRGSVAEPGIRACLRCMSRKGWRFNSSPTHRVKRGALSSVVDLPDIEWTRGSVGRASRLHREGQRFESFRVHKVQSGGVVA